MTWCGGSFTRDPRHVVTFDDGGNSPGPGNTALATWAHHLWETPYVLRRDGMLWCLPCYTHDAGRPVIEPNHGPRTVIRP